MQLLAVALLVWLAGCDDNTCDDPPVNTYSCEPIPNGSHGCVGGPYYFQGGGRMDTDKTFPIGCAASVPECSAFYRGSRRTFVCDDNRDNPGDSGVSPAPEWYELL